MIVFVHVIVENFTQTKNGMIMKVDVGWKSQQNIVDAKKFMLGIASECENNCESEEYLKNRFCVKSITDD